MQRNESLAECSHPDESCGILSVTGLQGAQSEVIRAIVSGYSPCYGAAHHASTLETRPDGIGGSALLMCGPSLQLPVGLPLEHGSRERGRVPGAAIGRRDRARGAAAGAHDIAAARASCAAPCGAAGVARAPCAAWCDGQLGYGCGFAPRDRAKLTSLVSLAWPAGPVACPADAGLCFFAGPWDREMTGGSWHGSWVATATRRTTVPPALDGPMRGRQFHSTSASPAGVEVSDQVA